MIKLTKQQQRALDILKDAQKQYNKDIWLTWVNEYWKVCPTIFNDDYTKKTFVLAQVNFKTWIALVNKGYIEKVKRVPYYTHNTEKSSYDYGYVFKQNTEMR